ncbi:hypothetical protein [Papillibacter cinnamivorans]|uniref:Uncharacterized protein n=1 Tax=Papillibacter cinnamivorans DSM 12816 TaxID=1122930 RepID=A0A1W1YYT3_9FIRM|nr:hypothetical protein [Papillibacter cinnamivorans]SMC41242.1 hypothetical protein SAMN02745168_0782 [Papillibacter cinnamivorans DSM 12816]
MKTSTNTLITSAEAINIFVRQMKRSRTRSETNISRNKSILKNASLTDILKIEPEFESLLETARHDTRKNRDKLYVIYKHRLQKLVGWHGRNENLQSSQAYRIAINALCDALQY